eukprot:scaffold24136_cov14-Prasinocladus_malaysianus.AAC.1
MEGAVPETLTASAAIAGADLSFRFGLWLPAAPAKDLAELDPDDDLPLPRVLVLSKVWHTHTHHCREYNGFQITVFVSSPCPQAALKGPPSRAVLE